MTDPPFKTGDEVRLNTGKSKIVVLEVDYYDDGIRCLTTRSSVGDLLDENTLPNRDGISASPMRARFIIVKSIAANGAKPKTSCTSTINQRKKNQS